MNSFIVFTIQSISIDVSKIGHGISKTGVAGSSLYCPHKLKITLQSQSLVNIISL